MLAYRLCHSSVGEWLGRPVKEVHDMDLWRYYVCQAVAKRVLLLLDKGEL